MARLVFSQLARARGKIRAVLTGPSVLAFLPALTLATYWIAGETALIIVALGLPILYAFSGVVGPARPISDHDGVTGLLLRDGFDAAVERVFAQTASPNLRSACFELEIDDYQDISHRQGQAACDHIMSCVGERLVSALRSGDVVARIGDSRFGICLMPVRQLDLELCIQMSGRLQAMVEDPIALDGLSLYVTASVGFCARDRTPADNAKAWQDAAKTALGEAKAVGPATIRAFSTDMRRRAQTQSDLSGEAAHALENGQIQPWFQPQVSTDTGKITGFEALARWMHPVRGMIAPDTFLPILENAGLMERLGEVILYNSLAAIKSWDAAGCNIPCVGINASQSELRDANFVDKIRWELDRFDLTTDRLCVEVLETVVCSNSDDVISRNIAGLSDIGCRIDLDDFGTGHASIASLRRFKVSRIKIDRSFVTKADRDADQQQMVAAILTMAERLELETLAEGVETVGEHALLAQLGCNHVQGYGIGKPMPFNKTIDWIEQHETKLQDTPQIGRQTG